MRELLRANLRRSLGGMAEADRLAAAWPVVCGAAMAAHGRVVGYEDGVVAVEVYDAEWMGQMLSMQGQIGSELGRIAGVRVTGVHFERKFLRG
jgi:predicted nucleic acid-binding Zn ribbon protein